MTAGEAQRQYQCALEWRRMLRYSGHGLVSFSADLAEADQQVADAEAERDRAYVDETLRRMETANG